MSVASLRISRSRNAQVAPKAVVDAQHADIIYGVNTDHRTTPRRASTPGPQSDRLAHVSPFGVPGAETINRHRRRAARLYRVPEQSLGCGRLPIGVGLRADRHDKPLKSQWQVGSHCGAGSQPERYNEAWGVVKEYPHDRAAGGIARHTAFRPSRVYLSLTEKAAEQSVAFGDEFFAWHAAIRIARKLRLQPVKEEHFKPATVLGLDDATRLQFE